jgi:hypothetical protein
MVAPFDRQDGDTRRIDEELISWDDSQDGFYPAYHLVNTVVEDKVDPKMVSVRDLFERFRFTIPEYQRGFAWDEGNISQFWQEISAIIDTELSKAQLDDLFMGSIFLVQTPGESTDRSVDIIDGQQRITVFTLLLKILVEELDDIDTEEIGDQDVVDQLDIYTNGLQNLVIENLADTPKLELSTHNQEFYRALFGGEADLVAFIRAQDRAVWNKKTNAIHPEDFLERLEISGEDIERNRSFDDTNKRLLNAYCQLRDLVRATTDGRDTTASAILLLNVAGYFINSFQLTVFQIPDQYPTLMMRIFQSLNDRGMDLAEVDIIRARIASVLAGEQDELRQDTLDEWEEVIAALGTDHETISDYLIEFLLTMRDVPDSFTRGDVAKHMMSAFSTTVVSEKVKLESELQNSSSTRRFITDIRDNVEAYRSVRAADERPLEGLEEDVAKSCQSVLERLMYLRTSQWRALVFKAYTMVKDGRTASQHTFLEMLRTIESLTYRHLIMGLSANRMEVVYQAGIETLSDGELSRVPEELVGSFTEEYPTAMGQSFAISLLSDIEPTRKHMKALFWRLTASRTYDGGIFSKEFEFSVVEYEHIVPQSPIQRKDRYDKYAWFRPFFGSMGLDRFDEFLSTAISEEDDELLEELMDAVVTHDYANGCLLLDSVNGSIQNDPFDSKIPRYLLTEGFDDVPVNRFFDEPRLPSGAETLKDTAHPVVAEENHEEDEEVEAICERIGSKYGIHDQARHPVDDLVVALRSREEYDEAARSVRDWWTFDRLVERKIGLTETILDDLCLRDGEFEDLDVRDEIEDNMNRRVRMFLAAKA